MHGAGQDCERNYTRLSACEAERVIMVAFFALHCRASAHGASRMCLLHGDVIDLGHFGPSAAAADGGRHRQRLHLFLRLVQLRLHLQVA